MIAASARPIGTESMSPRGDLSLAERKIQLSTLYVTQSESIPAIKRFGRAILGFDNYRADSESAPRLQNALDGVL